MPALQSPPLPASHPFLPLPRLPLLLLALTLLSTCPRPACAQLPPGAGYAFPPAVRIGQTTDVQLGVFDPTDDLQWFIHHPKIQLERSGPLSDFHLPPPPYWTGTRGGTNALPIPREAPARITVAADAEPGFALWQIASANGPSRTARILLSHDPEILEHRSRDLPQILPQFPVAVSGRLSRLTEVDRYEFVAPDNGPVSVSLMARQLGADFRGILQARNAHGELLAEFADTQGMDGTLTFSTTAGERFLVSLHDVDFRGDRAYVYRLLFTRTPTVLATVPARLQLGTTTDVEIIGNGFQTGLRGLQTLRQTVAATDSPGTHSLQVRIDSPTIPVTCSIPLSQLPELAAVPGQLSSIPSPGAISGRLTPDHPEQKILFNATADQQLQIKLQSVGIGCSLDTQLTILAPDGSLIAENDDADGLTDSSIEFKPTVSGNHTCLVRTHSPLLGNPDEIFRLEVQPPAPGFHLSIPQQLSLPSAGQLELTVTARRSGGFDGPIRLSVNGLPTGVTAEGEWVIPAGKTEVKGLLKCAPDAPVTAAAVQVSGTADIAQTTLTQIASAAASGNLCPRTAEQKNTSFALLAITMTPPIDVLVIDRERQRDVPRGSTYAAELEIVRKNGFNGPVTLVMSAQQSRNRQGIRGTTTVVPPSESRALFPCFMPEWLATDITRRMVVHGIVDVPDPQGNLRQLTKPGDARITMIMEGALLKLACDISDIRVPAGKTCNIPLSISRSDRLTGPVKIEVLVPEEAVGLLNAQTLTLNPNETSALLQINSLPDSQLLGTWQLRIAASSLLDDRWPVISETVADVLFQNPETVTVPQTE